VSRPVAVVTGAARGIGLETAQRLSASHRVALLDLDGSAVERAAAEIGDAVAFGCDITDPESVRAAVNGTVAECGGIDVCISNAGIATAGALRHLDPDVLAAQLNVNLTGNWRVIHACLPHLVARRGYVLAVASVAAIVPPPGLGAYAASKAGLEQLLDVLRSEVRHLGVDVGVAYFSWIDTEMVRGAERQHPGFAAMREGLRGPAGRTLPVARAADAIARGVERRSRRVVAPGFVGALYRLRGLLPELLERGAAKAGPEADRYTAEMVAQRGAFAAGLRPGELGSEAAARSMGRSDAAAPPSEPAAPSAAAPPATTARPR
jgi:NAD(P)-dependent dehydrogenase (short-subunit alcohol dehydrogenase family)